MISSVAARVGYDCALGSGDWHIWALRRSPEMVVGSEDLCVACAVTCDT